MLCYASVFSLLRDIIRTCVIAIGGEAQTRSNIGFLTRFVGKRGMSLVILFSCIPFLSIRLWISVPVTVCYKWNRHSISLELLYQLSQISVVIHYIG